MKVGIHVLGALFGCVCAIAFAVAPLVAHADAGPAKALAPVTKDANPSTTSSHGKRHMHRGNVNRKDDGCGS